MKRLVLFFACIAFAALANAQVAFSVNNYYRHTGEASDTVNYTNKTTLYKVWEITFSDRYLYTVEADMDELSGASTITTVLQGSLDNTNWTPLDTLTATADGILRFAIQGWDDDNGLDFKYMRLKNTLNTTGKWDINYVTVKITPKP
jgi:hypothetical protein